MPIKFLRKLRYLFLRMYNPKKAEHMCRLCYRSAHYADKICPFDIYICEKDKCVWTDEALEYLKEEQLHLKQRSIIQKIIDFFIT